MAYPTVLINSSTGSDTTASGAGPSTAISGSTGRTRNTGSQLQFGLFGATDDLSGVATDGSAVLYMAISTAGQRNFSSIAATRNTRDTTTGNMTSGSAVLSALGSTTGWAVGEVIKVTGAGAAAADLYSTILTVDSGTQVTLNNTAGTSVTGNAVENPKQFTLTTSQGVNTGTTNTAWAVGGKRATCSGTNSRKLAENNGQPGDAMPGWRVRMESGFTDTFTTTWTWRRAGTLSEGPIIFEGDPAAGTVPVLTWSNNGNALNSTAAIQVFQNMDIRNTNATKTASVVCGMSNQGMRTFRNIKAAHATDRFWVGFGALSGTIIQDCELGHLANRAVDIVDADVEIINCWFHDIGSNCAVLTSGSSAANTLIVDTIIESVTGDGIRNTKTHANSSIGGLTLLNCTIDTCSGDAIEITATSAQISSARLTMYNCSISNITGTAINYSGSGIGNVEGVIANIRNNNFYTVGAICSVSTIVTEDNTTLDPQYVDASNGDFSIGTNLRAKGYPLGGTLPIGKSLTYNYKDIGAAQRKEYASNPMISSGF